MYAYSKDESRWGFQPVFGHEEYLYICEMPINEVNYLMTDERTHEYGEPIGENPQTLAPGFQFYFFERANFWPKIATLAPCLRKFGPQNRHYFTNYKPKIAKFRIKIATFRQI